MTQINKQVEDFINKNVDIQRAIMNDYVSLRKLARFIARRLEMKNTEAIVSAIRRYKGSDEKMYNYENALEIVRKSKVSTKSDIISVAVEKSNAISKVLPSLFELINYNKSEVLRIIQAEESIKIIIDRRNFDTVMKYIPEDEIVHVEKDLAEINLHLADEATKTPGIVSVIFSELMINGINILETMSCVPEMILFVKENELLNAYSVIFNLLKE